MKELSQNDSQADQASNMGEILASINRNRMSAHQSNIKTVAGIPRVPHYLSPHQQGSTTSVNIKYRQLSNHIPPKNLPVMSLSQQESQLNEPVNITFEDLHQSGPNKLPGRVNSNFNPKEFFDDDPDDLNNEILNKFREEHQEKKIKLKPSKKTEAPLSIKRSKRDESGSPLRSGQPNSNPLSPHGLKQYSNY